MDDPTPAAVDDAVLPIPLAAKSGFQRKPGGSKVVRSGIVYIGVLVCLLWVFHDMDWRLLARSVGSINWAWAGLGILLNVLSTVSMGFRWHLLLRPVGRIRAARTTQALYAAFFINDVLPMRLGEPARALIVSRWMSSEWVAVIPSMALERLFEGVWLAIGMGITAILVPLPPDLDHAANIFGAVILALVALALALTVGGKKNRANGRARTVRGPKLFRWVGAMLNRLREGFGSIGLSHIFFLALFISMALIACQALAFWCFTLAFGLPLSFWTGAAVFFIVVFGTALPNAPANIGSYQFFCVVGLALFKVGKAAAAGFSLVAFVLLTLPTFVIGFLCLSKTGISLSEIRRMLKHPPKPA